MAMKRPLSLGLGAAALLLALVGCGAAEPSPSTAPSAESTPAAVETSAPPVEDDAMSAIVAELQAVSPTVTGVVETEPGRWEISTTIVDPRGDDAASSEAQTATAICEKAVELGGAKVSVMESDGTTYVLYGHPSYGDVCTVV